MSHHLPPLLHDCSMARALCLTGGKHLDEGLGEARALGVIPLHVHRLLLDLRALVMHMVPMVMLVPVGDVQLGPGQGPDVGEHTTGA